MTIDKKVEAFRMRLEGHTYEEIASKLGCSKQYIQQEIGGGQMQPRSSFSCIYPNIEKYRRKNHLTISSFANLIGASGASSLSRMLGNHGNPKKKLIDKILEVTGMTYEEAFKTEE